MAVTEYKPKADLGCKYSYDKLENVVYLVSKEHVKDVIIDNGEAFISGLTEVPIRIDCFNIAFNEETSLDERYKFTKQVTFSVNGYATHKDFNDKFYVILKSKDGTLWMVNVDFPSKVTYTFNLTKDAYRTDFTFTTPSNFPTLRLSSDFNQGTRECIGYMKCSIKELKLLENDYCSFDSTSGIVYTYDNTFKDVQYLGESCTFTEAFDGEDVTTTIEFNIAFDAYKSSWHYNLIEFLQNLYSAIVITSCGNAMLGGFHFGLEPQFKINANAQNGSSDIITITLSESSMNGSSMVEDWSVENVTDKLLRYLPEYYECVSNGTAKYLVREKLLKNGQTTGEFEALEGYEEDFPELNIVGTFSNIKTFPNADCHDIGCTLNTNMPSVINYTQATCYTYNLMATCDWNAGIMPSNLTITPSSGVAYSSYTVTLCNSETPTSAKTNTFTISYGDNPNVKRFKVILTPQGILTPQVQEINCLKQNVQFTYNPSCPITVTNIDSKLTYEIANGVLKVNTPRNESTTNTVVWNISLQNCNGNSGTAQIIQDKTYEMWVDTDGYVCDSGNSYVLQARYTGTTSTNINTLTSETRKGALITEHDSRCVGHDTRWVSSSTYTCIDGDKWSIEEQEISYDGTNWNKNGITRLGTMVESASSFCNQEVQYKWVLTDQWQCYGNVVPKFMAAYRDSTTYTLACNSSSVLTTSETSPSGYVYTGMTSAIIGNCVTSIGSSALAYCKSLASIVIPNSVTTINRRAFIMCDSLTNVIIPDSVTWIGEEAFYNCSSLTSCTIGSGITYMDDRTFAECTSLSSITIKAVNPPTLGGGENFYYTNNCPIYVPSTSVIAYKEAANWSTYADRIQAIP